MRHWNACHCSSRPAWLLRRLQFGQGHRAAIWGSRQRARYGRGVDRRNIREFEEATVIVAAAGRQLRCKHGIHPAITHAEWNSGHTVSDILRHLKLLLPALLMDGVSNRFVELIGGAGTFRIERE